MGLRPATILVIALLAVAAICPVEAAKTTRIDDPDMYAVYTALLAEKPPGWKSLAVENVTRPAPGESGLPCHKPPKVSGEWGEAVTDYRNLNRQESRLRWRFQVNGRKVTLIGADEVSRFDRVVTLSAVGFDHAK